MQSTNFIIKFSPEFNKYLETFLKEHYRKNPKGKETFKNFLNSLIQKLREKGCLNPELKTSFMNFPTNIPQEVKENYHLVKVKFKVPELRGSAREGRLICLCNKKENEIYILTVYSHKQFAKQPSIELIKTWLKILNLS